MLKVYAGLVLASGISLVAQSPARSAEAGAYNGTWTVEFVTERGLCDGSRTYSVAVQEGHVRLVTSDTATRLTGHVGADGTVGLSVSQGSASGSVLGRLRERSGSGSWKVSALCSGSWVAHRRSSATAQAY